MTLQFQFLRSFIEHGSARVSPFFFWSGLNTRESQILSPVLMTFPRGDQSEFGLVLLTSDNHIL